MLESAGTSSRMFCTLMPIAFTMHCIAGVHACQLVLFAVMRNITCARLLILLCMLLAAAIERWTEERNKTPAALAKSLERKRAWSASRLQRSAL